ncbi:MAG: alpha/beta fold hydrolase [Microcoleaceae cyanobacterium MO_207.B10]|nr:alpha/beta fold hydrolase [Microcoleaceae cyanobacterium MO_207.B10]
MFMPGDINNLSDLTGVNSETTNTIIPEIDINNPLIFTPSAESLSVPITQLNDLDNIILPENLPIYEPTLDISTDESVDTLTGEAIGQAINQAVIQGYQYLQGFAATPEFEAKMDLAFGENWDKEANISLPEIAVISSAEINGANGAFAEATNTVYLSKEFLAQNLENIGEVTDVWLEEFGHYIDSQINIVDAQGDEGAIFSAVVQGKDLSEADIEALKSENDKAFVEIDGEILEIENNYQWVSYTIQPGDSLSQIALNTTGDANRYWDIANYNGISNPNLIYVGQQILVPGNSSTGNTVGVTTGNNDNWQSYTVQPGDSLWAIAQRTTGDGNRYWDIANYNDIDNPSAIYVGQEILVPGNSSTGTSVRVTTGGSSGTSNSSPFNTLPGSPILPDGIVDDSSPDPIPVDIYPTVNSVIESSNRPESYNIAFERIDSPGYIENNVDTWIVIHGWDSSAGNFNDLASAIEGYDDGNYRQVLTLDWSSMANTGGLLEFQGISPQGRNNLHDAAIWIEEVAEAAVEQLNEWGFDRNKINLAGHSLGAYVAYEISEELGHVNNLVALDPANSTAGGYKGWYLSADEIDFSRYSGRSWGFYSSPAGNENIARTADESFKIDFFAANPNESHRVVRDLWKHMLENPSGEISQYFGLEDINEYDKPWPVDDPGSWSDFEAIIYAKDLYSYSLGNSYWVPEMLTERTFFPNLRITETTVAA